MGRAGGGRGEGEQKPRRLRELGIRKNTSMKSSILEPAKFESNPGSEKNLAEAIYQILELLKSRITLLDETTVGIKAVR
jgi:hypothetical protein